MFSFFDTSFGIFEAQPFLQQIVNDEGHADKGNHFDEVDLQAFKQRQETFLLDNLLQAMLCGPVTVRIDRL